MAVLLDPLDLVANAVQSVAGMEQDVCRVLVKVQLFRRNQGDAPLFAVLAHDIAGVGYVLTHHLQPLAPEEGNVKGLLHPLLALGEREKRMEQTLNISLFWGKRLEMVGQHVPNTSDVVSKDGEQRSIALVAAEELDLDEDTANILFHSGNTLDGIRNKVQRIKEHGHLSFDDWD